jgi:hypothetical protein
MLSAAKHLGADHDRPFAEFTLSATNVLRVTLCDCSNCQELIFTLEPCYRKNYGHVANRIVATCGMSVVSQY